MFSKFPTSTPLRQFYKGILDFHPRDTSLDNGCYPPYLCPSSVIENDREVLSMVHCIVVGCGSKSGKHKLSFHTIPKIVSNQGQEHEERTKERRTRWIATISRNDTKAKRVLDSQRVCGRHFVSGKAAKDWDVDNIDWVPTLYLGKKNRLRSLKRARLPQQKLEANGLRNGENGS